MELLKPDGTKNKPYHPVNKERQNSKHRTTVFENVGKNTKDVFWGDGLTENIKLHGQQAMLHLNYTYTGVSELKHKNKTTTSCTTKTTCLNKRPRHHWYC